MQKPDFIHPTQKYSGKTKWINLIGVILFVGIVLLVGVIVMWGFIYITQKPSDANGTQVKKVLAAEKEEFSHYPPVKTKKYVTINIINGTGNTEYEGEIVKTLVESGYSLSNIELENTEVIGDIGPTITSNADFEKIVVNIKDVLKSVIPEIPYGIPNDDPNIDNGFDVVITTGNRVANTKISTKDTSLSRFE